MYNPEKFASGVVDLAMEAHMLAALDHPNILQIRGVASSGPRGLLEGCFDDYFLIIDKLSETLEDRICTWVKRMKRLNRRCLFGKDKREAKRKQLSCSNSFKLHTRFLVLSNTFTAWESFIEISSQPTSAL